MSAPRSAPRSALKAPACTPETRTALNDLRDALSARLEIDDTHERLRRAHTSYRGLSTSIADASRARLLRTERTELAVGLLERAGYAVEGLDNVVTGVLNVWDGEQDFLACAAPFFSA